MLNDFPQFNNANECIFVRNDKWIKFIFIGFFFSENSSKELNILFSRKFAVNMVTTNTFYFLEPPWKSDPVSPTVPDLSTQRAVKNMR